MSATTQLSHPALESPPVQVANPRLTRRALSYQAAITAITEPNSPVLPLLTASIATHLLLVAWFGAGVPAIAVRVRSVPAAPTAAIIENIELPAPPPPEVLPPQPAEDTLTPDAPAPAAALDLPAMPEVQTIAAVPASVPVSFGIGVTGNVRVVSDAANASGAVGSRRFAEPVALDLNAENNLVLPAISYPARAKRLRQIGTVLVEFRTNSSGDISAVRVRHSSGHAALDEAARNNLERGRWKGAPGYYVKAYEFSLQ